MTTASLTPGDRQAMGLLEACTNANAIAEFLEESADNSTACVTNTVWLFVGPHVWAGRVALEARKKRDAATTIRGLTAEIEGVRRAVAERLAQHQDNLELWETGVLTPTEPDEDERRVTMERLRAAIAELERLQDL